MRLLFLLLSITLFPDALAQTSDVTPEILMAPVAEQNSVAPAVNTATTIGVNYLIPAKTVVLLTLDTTVSSKTAVPGDFFQLKVAQDLKINNQVIIPAGTPATGEVIHAQKAASFGKPGELLVTVRYIDLNGQKIKMRSFVPVQGKSNSNAAMTTSVALAVSVAPVVGMFAGFIRGGQIEMPANTNVQALVAADSIIAPLPTTEMQNNEHPINPATQATGDSQ